MFVYKDPVSPVKKYKYILIVFIILSGKYFHKSLFYVTLFLVSFFYITVLLEVEKQGIK